MFGMRTRWFPERSSSGNSSVAITVSSAMVTFSSQETFCETFSTMISYCEKALRFRVAFSRSQLSLFSSRSTCSRVGIAYSPSR